MYQHLNGRAGVVVGGTNVGVVRIDDTHVMLIDTGLNDTTARKVLRAVRDELNSEIVAILITHGHADHFGANAFTVKRTGAEVWAPDLDEMTLRHPLMQSIMLYGGADPVDAIRTKFLVAEPSPVNHIVHPGPLDIAGVEIEAIPLGGHSMNQLGYLVDGVFYCADVVFPQAALEKYPIPYLHGLTEHLVALERAESVVSTTVVPGHGPMEADIAEPVKRNRAVIDRVIEAIPHLLNEPTTTDDFARKLFTALEVPVNDASGFYLLKPTVGAYLSHLERCGVVDHIVENRGAFWRVR